MKFLQVFQEKERETQAGSGKQNPFYCAKLKKYERDAAYESFLSILDLNILQFNNKFLDMVTVRHLLLLEQDL